MDAAGCRRVLADALGRERGVDYRKSMEGLFGAVDPRRDVAVSNAARLLRHHEAIGNARPSTMSPATRVADILGELGPYLERGGD